MHRLRFGLLVAGLAATACSSTTSHPAMVSIRDAHGQQGITEDARARQVVAFASAQVGRRYCWGGTGPDCYDCSGLVLSAWGSAGVPLPRTARAMGSMLADVPFDDVRAGDILWWPWHVGIYAGGGWSIEALDSRHGVVRRQVTNPYRVLRPQRVD